MGVHRAICFCLGLFCLTVQAKTIRIMSFNILYGGDHWYPLALTVQAIRRSGADVMGIQESDENGEKIAQLLGYHWHEVEGGIRRGGILSRFPIVEKHRYGATIEIEKENRIDVFSTHLRSNPYEPEEIKLGRLRSQTEVIASARRGRGREITAILDEMNEKLSREQPVFLLGDFNEPSHLDWTAGAGPAGAKLHAMQVVWPTSQAIAQRGLKDAFRTFFPNEIRNKGYTWTTRSNPAEVHDRIDILYFSGRTVSLTNVQIMGEWRGPEVDIVGSFPFPSDHRAVIGTFNINRMR